MMDQFVVGEQVVHGRRALYVRRFRYMSSDGRVTLEFAIQPPASAGFTSTWLKWVKYI